LITLGQFIAAVGLALIGLVLILVYVLNFQDFIGEILLFIGLACLVVRACENVEIPKR
jgi:hypothetical protein